MKIHILGTGTSQGVPVITCTCKVCTSSDERDKRLRSAIWIHSEAASVVIDVGPDFRYQMLRAKAHDLDAIMITHQHKDHVAGLDDVRPFNYLLHKVIDVYAEAPVQEALKNEFSYIFNSPKEIFGLPKINLRDVFPNQKIKVGDLDFLPIRVMHHQLPILGFRVGNFAYITDAKTIDEENKSLLQNLEVLVINALQYEPHHAHLTVAEALDLIAELNPKKTYLTHMSHLLGLHAEIEATLPDGVFLAYDGLEIEL